MNESINIENIFLIQRLKRIFTYWEKNIDIMPNKLLIPLQHSLDYSPYFSILFRKKYRRILELIMTTIKYLSSFLIYSAIFQYDKSLINPIEPRYIIHNLKLLNTTNQIVLNFYAQHERTVNAPNEFLGELHTYNDAFEQSSGQQSIFNDGNFI